MKKQNLHQWLPLLVTLVILTSCSRKEFSGSNTADNADKYENAKPADDYTHPAVISISDAVAKSNKEGEMYYDNEYGYRYWKFCDGKYYLDAKYESGARPDKKTVKKNARKHRKKVEENDYAHE